MLRLRRTLSRGSRVACAVLGALGVACGAAPEADPTDTFTGAVAGGEISGPEDDFVVRVIGREPKPYPGVACTGTLLAPNLVLTALHCVAVFDPQADYACRTDGSLPAGSVGGWIGETLAPENVEIYVGNMLPLTVISAYGERILGSGATDVCTDDIAFVVLDRPLPMRGVPLRNARPVVEGELMTVIGYGQSERPDFPRNRRSGVPVLEVGPKDTTGVQGTASPRTFLVGDGPCNGDEGAPALSEETGAVTGVFSSPYFGDCSVAGSHGWFTQVSPYVSLIQRAFDAAGVRPHLETTSDAPAPPARASCSLRAGNDGLGLTAPALGALVLLLMRRGRALHRTTRTRPGG